MCWASDSLAFSQVLDDKLRNEHHEWMNEWMRVYVDKSLDCCICFLEHKAPFSPLFVLANDTSYNTRVFVENLIKFPGQQRKNKPSSA